jgi:UDP-glucose/iron transport system ATP-binding protein
VTGGVDGRPRLRLEALASPLVGPFDLTLARGACAAITGASGAGKSLFLRLIADLDPNRGKVWLDGRERATFPAPAWRRQVVYAAAESGWWHADVAAHFAPPQRAAAKKLADRLGLDPALFEGPVSRLSTGERQRLALIRAFLLASPVLLLDEPTGPLDPDSTARVEAVLAERLADGTAIVIVSHDAAQAARLAAVSYRMENRKLHPA